MACENRIKNWVPLAVMAITAICLPNRGFASDGAEVLAPPQPVQAVLSKYCFECHAEKKIKGMVRFDTLATLDLKTRLDLLNKTQEQVYFNEMPPEDAQQPGAEERKLLAGWVRGELVKLNAPLIEDKLRYPDYGNNVDHRKLFSGEIKDKPFSPARRWLVSPQIFNERVIDIFKPDTKEREGMRQRAFYGVTNPFVLPEQSGVRDYSINSLDGGHLLLMLTNADWISAKQLRPARVKAGELKEKVFENPADKWSPKSTPAAFETIILKKTKPTDAEMIAVIKAQFDCVLQRKASDAELEKYLALTRSAIELGGNVEGVRQMLISVLLESEFLYRLEFGDGTADEFGRKLLSPREASYAISYALGDRNPDATLVRAAETGQLKSKEDYKREVSRLLADENYYSGPIDKTLDGKHLHSDLTPHPRIIRFFREFFGYCNAVKIFKDKNRSNGFYDNPARGSSGTGGILIEEADMLVEWYVKQDKNVFANLLGTEVFFAAPYEPTYGTGKPRTQTERVDALNKIYDLLKDTDWKKNPKKVSEENKEAVEVIKKNLLWNGGNEKDIKQIMSHVAAFREKGLNPHPAWNYPFGIHKLTPWVHSYSINPPEWEYPKEQPFKIENRKGILTHPAWLIAHSSNFHTDPIRRGRWIQEKLLAGRVPDVPITVDAKVPEDPHMTLRERVESVTGQDKAACWKCHQYMNPLGYPFEKFDDFGRFRSEEPLENPENLISKAKGKYDADNYKTKPVSTVGDLRGTGDPKLDGPVKDAIDLIDRLNKSDRVRQSIIRHAFRFYMGRNEMLTDSQTLIAADKAYVESGGSFKAVIVSLLTSDSFMYRK